jgi:tetratricopeptide (TPR) repeat protein
MAVDDYRQDHAAHRPAAAAADRRRRRLRDARSPLALSRAHVAQGANDADAHYQLGAAVGLRASYIATVEGSAVGAFRAAREAYDEHERVMALDPRRKDAGLIVGTYRYLVSVLSLPLRWMAYMAGFGGGREKGLHLIEEAAAYPGDSQTDARFALILLYNREKRYDDALGQLATLRERYPRNRLAVLETGSTNLRAGRAAEAERLLDEGIRRLATDTRPRMFGGALAPSAAPPAWRRPRRGARQDPPPGWRSRGATRARAASGGQARGEGRDRATAQKNFRAIALCESDDGAPADEARCGSSDIEMQMQNAKCKMRC